MRPARLKTVDDLKKFLEEIPGHYQIAVIGEYCASDDTGFEIWVDPFEESRNPSITIAIPEN